MKPRTGDDYQRRVARVIEAIRADPAAPHTMQSLAAVAHLPPFHSHRIYRALTGEGVFETAQQSAWRWMPHRSATSPFEFH